MASPRALHHALIASCFSYNRGDVWRRSVRPVARARRGVCGRHRGRRRSPRPRAAGALFVGGCASGASWRRASVAAGEEWGGGRRKKKATQARCFSAHERARCPLTRRRCGTGSTSSRRWPGGTRARRDDGAQGVLGDREWHGFKLQPALVSRLGRIVSGGGRSTRQAETAFL